jgi:hypothetical protein
MGLVLTMGMDQAEAGGVRKRFCEARCFDRGWVVVREWSRQERSRQVGLNPHKRGFRRGCSHRHSEGYRGDILEGLEVMLARRLKWPYLEMG